MYLCWRRNTSHDKLRIRFSACIVKNLNAEWSFQIENKKKLKLKLNPILISRKFSFPVLVVQLKRTKLSLTQADNNGTLCQLDCRSISSFHVQCIYFFILRQIALQIRFNIERYFKIKFPWRSFRSVCKENRLSNVSFACIGRARYNSNKNDARHINCNNKMSTGARSRGKQLPGRRRFPELGNQVALLEQDIKNELSVASAVGLARPSTENSFSAAHSISNPVHRLSDRFFGNSCFSQYFHDVESCKSSKWKYWLSRRKASKKRWNWETVREKTIEVLRHFSQ